MSLFRASPRHYHARHRRDPAAATPGRGRKSLPVCLRHAPGAGWRWPEPAARPALPWSVGPGPAERTMPARRSARQPATDEVADPVSPLFSGLGHLRRVGPEQQPGGAGDHDGVAVVDDTKAAADHLASG